MLLRRMTKHVRTQNWFAVGLDFLIVVVGVFIGIQVANWNEERTQQARDEVLLARLMDDFEQIVAFGETRMPKYRESAAQVSDLISTIRSGVDPRLTQDFQDQIAGSVIVWAVTEIAPT